LVRPHTHITSVQSPVDEFRSNLKEINVLYLNADDRGCYTPMFGSLVYLGMVSAAEGYFRSLLRRLILVDEACKHNASNRTLTYGAALHHTKDLLPEALFEGISLASTKSIAYELKTLCNISNMGKDGNVPEMLKQLFKNFEMICQVRHCGIHRFGKLGSQQALRLGMEKHKPLLEKPLALTVTQLQEIAEALEALIRAVNSYCFADILRRTYSASLCGKDKVKLYQETWQLDWDQDQKRFVEYYEMFASVGGAQPSDSVEGMYAAFIQSVTGQPKKRQTANNS
jgi:hypothetical protein